MTTEKQSITEENISSAIEEKGSETEDAIYINIGPESIQMTSGDANGNEFTVEPLGLPLIANSNMRIIPKSKKFKQSPDRFSFFSLDVEKNGDSDGAATKANFALLAKVVKKVQTTNKKRVFTVTENRYTAIKLHDLGIKFVYVPQTFKHAKDPKDRVYSAREICTEFIFLEN
jgi:hypothetical protein